LRSKEQPTAWQLKEKHVPEIPVWRSTWARQEPKDLGEAQTIRARYETIQWKSFDYPARPMKDAVRMTAVIMDG
jgi:hypothetical protein